MVVNGGVRFFVVASVSECYSNFLECHLPTRENILLLLVETGYACTSVTFDFSCSIIPARRGAAASSVFGAFSGDIGRKVGTMFVKRSNYQRKLPEAA